MNPLLDNLASVDVIQKVFELQLPILPEMAEELGYEDFSEILEVLGMVTDDDEYDEDIYNDGVIVAIPF